MARLLLVARGMSDPNDLPPWLLRLIRTSSTIRRLGLDPDDIAQEVLVALLERQRARGGPLFREGRYAFLDVLRRHARQPRWEPMSEELEPPRRPDIERQVANRRAMRQMNDRVGRWRAPHRRAMSLRAQRGLSTRELATEIGVSRGEAAKLLKCCLDELRPIREATRI